MTWNFLKVYVGINSIKIKKNCIITIRRKLKLSLSRKKYYYTARRRNLVMKSHKSTGAKRQPLINCAFIMHFITCTFYYEGLRVARVDFRIKLSLGFFFFFYLVRIVLRIHIEEEKKDKQKIAQAW